MPFINYTPILFSLLLVSCTHNTEQKHAEVKTQPAAVYARPGNIMDTIARYSGKDSTNITFGGDCDLIDLFYMGSINNTEFAAHSQLDCDAMFTFYNKVDGVWQSPDTLLTCCNYNQFYRKDLNKDGYRDIRFTCFGEDKFLEFLYNPKTKRFSLSKADKSAMQEMWQNTHPNESDTGTL